MNITPKARVAIVVALATVLLTGCSAAAPSTTDGVSTPSTTAAPQARPDDLDIKVVDVLNPTTLVVTPFRDTDSLYGTTFTLHVIDFSTPVKDQCGYEETLALAKATIGTHMWSINYSFVKDGVWIDANGDHNGALDATGIEYEKTLMLAGDAYLKGDAQFNYLLNAQRQAKDAGTGLWTTCPGFGA